jgi:hypothetical protein
MVCKVGVQINGVWMHGLRNGPRKYKQNIVKLPLVKPINLEWGYFALKYSLANGRK